MCRFLTVSVPGRLVPDVPYAFQDSVQFAEHKNRSITTLCPRDWISFVVTSGGCSCTLYHPPKKPVDNAKKIAKYRKQGWSEVKIQRAISASLNHQEDASPGLRDDICDLLVALGETYGELRISLHWYSGNIGTEVFALDDSGQISLSDFKEDATVFTSESTMVLKRTAR